MENSLAQPLDGGDTAVREIAVAFRKEIRTIEESRSSIDKAASVHSQGSTEDKKRKAQNAREEGLRASQNAKDAIHRIDNLISPSTRDRDRKAHEKMKKNYRLDTASDELEKASKDLKAAFSNFEEACKKPSTMSLPEDLESGRSSSPGVDFRKEIQLQETTTKNSQAEAEIHAQCMDSYAGQVGHVAETVRTLRQVTADLGQIARGQNDRIDSIQDYAERAATASQGAGDEVQLTNTNQRNNNKWIWRALLLAVILCSIIMYVIVHKANR